MKNAIVRGTAGGIAKALEENYVDAGRTHIAGSRHPIREIRVRANVVVGS